MTTAMPYQLVTPTPWTEEVIPFAAKDGFACNLIHVKGRAASKKGPVALVHGADARANLFRAPVETTLVDYLIERGYYVWLKNWRASIDLKFSNWTLDQAAVYDHPAAVEKVVEQTGARSVKAVIHCQGCTSFMILAVAGLLPQVYVIVSDAVSLHTVNPPWASFRMKMSVPVLRSLTPYLDPQWGIKALNMLAKAVTEVVWLSHHECKNLVCKMVSFTCGAGFPALWSQPNLNGETHEWLRWEFAKVPISFFGQMIKCVHAGHLVPVDGLKEFPPIYSHCFHKRMCRPRSSTAKRTCASCRKASPTPSSGSTGTPTNRHKPTRCPTTVTWMCSWEKMRAATFFP